MQGGIVFRNCLYQLNKLEYDLINELTMNLICVTINRFSSAKYFEDMYTVLAKLFRYNLLFIFILFVKLNINVRGLTNFILNLH